MDVDIDGQERTARAVQSEVAHPRFLARFPQGDISHIGIPIGVPSELEPAIELAVMGEEKVTSITGEDPCRSGNMSLVANAPETIGTPLYIGARPFHRNDEGRTTVFKEPGGESQTMLDTILSSLSGSTALGTYLAIFGLLLACGLGIPLPEDITLLAAGYLAAEDVISLPGAIGICLAGVLIGDSLIFALGRRFGERTLEAPGIRTVMTKKRVARSRHYFDRFGGKAVFFGRFIAGLRAPIFLVAGTLKMPYRTFLLLDGLGAVLSVPLITWLGWAFADDLHAILELIRSSHSVLLILAIGVGLLVLLSSYSVIERIVLDKFLQRVERRNHLRSDDE